MEEEIFYKLIPVKKVRYLFLSAQSSQLLWAANLGTAITFKTPPSSQPTRPSLTSSFASHKLLFWPVLGNMTACQLPMTASDTTQHQTWSMEQLTYTVGTQEVLFCTRQHVPAPMFAHHILYVSARKKFLFIPGSGMKGLMVNKILHNLWHGHHCYKVPEGLTCPAVKKEKTYPSCNDIKDLPLMYMADKLRVFFSELSSLMNVFLCSNSSS